MRLSRHAEAAVPAGQGVVADNVARALADLARRLAPVALDGLDMTCLLGFLALVPAGDTPPLSALAATVVAALEPFRAP